MTTTGDEKVVRLDSAQAALRKHFLGWQCRIRQRQMRHAGGQPSAGMRPQVTLDDAGDPLGNVIVLISHRDPAESTAKFRHMVRRTHDPRERLESALREMSANYFQYPDDFSDIMTALFGPGSGVAGALESAGNCVLHFDQYAQVYRIPCRVALVERGGAAWQATYWHNSLFNPNIPGDSTVLAFTPDWANAIADPAPR